jgi:DNA-binding MarR family transcriptional regulator
LKKGRNKAGEKTGTIPPASDKKRSEDSKRSAESQIEGLEKQGYIRLWRGYRQYPIYPLNQKKKFSPWEAFLDLSIEARGKDSPGFEFEKRIVHLKRGQLITSQRKLAKRWNWSRGSVTYFLGKLERRKIITVSPSNLGRIYSIITFLNYNKLNPSGE